MTEALMVGSTYDYKLTIWPSLIEFPGCNERPPEVKTPMYHDSGNTGQSACFSQ